MTKRREKRRHHPSGRQSHKEEDRAVRPNPTKGHGISTPKRKEQKKPVRGKRKSEGRVKSRLVGLFNRHTT